MNTAVRSRLADGFLIARAVDVDVTGVRVHIGIAGESFVNARFKTFQPQDARRDFGIRKFRFRGVPDNFARFENRSRRLATADFFRNPMQAKRRAV